MVTSRPTLVMSLRPRAADAGVRSRRRPTLDEALAAGLQREADVAVRNAVEPWRPGALNPLGPRAPPNMVTDPRGGWFSPSIPSERARGLQERLYGTYKDALPKTEEREGPGGLYKYKRTRYNSPSGEEITDLSLRQIVLNDEGPVRGVIEFVGDPGEERAVSWTFGDQSITLNGPRGYEQVVAVRATVQTILEINRAFPPQDGDVPALSYPDDAWNDYWETVTPLLWAMGRVVATRGLHYRPPQALVKLMASSSTAGDPFPDSGDETYITYANGRHVSVHMPDAFRVSLTAVGDEEYVNVAGQSFSYNELVRDREAFQAETMRLEPIHEQMRAAEEKAEREAREAQERARREMYEEAKRRDEEANRRDEERRAAEEAKLQAEWDEFEKWFTDALRVVVVPAAAVVAGLLTGPLLIGALLEPIIWRYDRWRYPDYPYF